MRRYPENEYRHTHNTSMAGKLIRVQAEYVARKYGIRGDADGHNKGTASGIPE